MHSYSLPKELDFLQCYLGDRELEYQTAFWLLSPFNSETWKCEFGYTRFSLDFRVRLDDGLLLTSARHSELLRTLKLWLCVQTHPDALGSLLIAKTSTYIKITSTLHLIDYFLLNAEQLQLSRFGLRNLTENDLAGLLRALNSDSHIANGVYQWNDRVAQFLRSKVAEVLPDVHARVTAKYEWMNDLSSPAEDRALNLSDEELVRARVWLWMNGFIGKGGGSDHFYALRTKELSALLYPNTLFGLRTHKPIPAELRLKSVERFTREFAGAAIRELPGQSLTESAMAVHIRPLKCLGLLAEIGVELPKSFLSGLSKRALFQELDLRPLGRVATVPVPVVLSALRGALEFSLEYAEDILDSVVAVLMACKIAGLNPQAYANRHDIRPLLTERIRAVGVHTWSLYCHMTFVEQNPTRHGSVWPAASEFFRRMRNNEGLFELLAVLFGALQTIVGTLSARRQSETLDLIAGSCLDSEKSRLVFHNRKSGPAELRAKEERPIPPVVVRLIQVVTAFQDRLIKEKLLKARTNLFSRPTQTGLALFPPHHMRANEDLDIFCDYIETALNSKSERYYLRHHQFRRFFAMLFFWGNAFGGLDTLRWFLGHTDARHLYNYITESTPGQVLSAVKANYAVEQLVAGAEESKALADLVEERFHTRNFAVLDMEELDQYVEELMHEGRVTVEPEFFDGLEGKSFRVIIKVTSTK
ncbi:MAG: hypothetical protein JNM76_10125 [Betaproteobacteria bacterium]|nr:hypothetical protein [Betaproteobacteria bacterium]